MTKETFLDVKCKHCGYGKLYGHEEMLDHLRRAGKFRRSAKPKQDIVFQLFESTAETMPCPQCAEIGMLVKQAEIDDDWGDAVCCKKCGQVIPAERLEIFPDSRLCMKCQTAVDSGAVDQENEYCPRCGSIMSLKTSNRTGITGYAMQCGDCGYR